jgi:hypothetical protein
VQKEIRCNFSCAIESIGSCEKEIWWNWVRRNCNQGEVLPLPEVAFGPGHKNAGVLDPSDVVSCAKKGGGRRPKKPAGNRRLATLPRPKFKSSHKRT